MKDYKCLKCELTSSLFDDEPRVCPKCGEPFASISFVFTYPPIEWPTQEETEVWRKACSGIKLPERPFVSPVPPVPDSGETVIPNFAPPGTDGKLDNEGLRNRIIVQHPPKDFRVQSVTLFLNDTISANMIKEEIPRKQDAEVPILACSGRQIGTVRNVHRSEHSGEIVGDFFFTADLRNKQIDKALNEATEVISKAANVPLTMGRDGPVVGHVANFRVEGGKVMADSYIDKDKAGQFDLSNSPRPLLELIQEHMTQHKTGFVEAATALLKQRKISPSDFRVMCGLPEPC